MDNWMPITIESPLSGSVVNTKIADAKGERNEQELVRQGNLWFFPDHSMYVYYQPTHWRDSDHDKQEKPE